MKVDYHFHPNLQAKNSVKRLKQLWETIEIRQFDAMICTEHSYKNAPAAYRRLIQTKPSHVPTMIFPGAELLTRENIDVIAFAEDDWYDAHPQLLEPFGLSLAETIAYLEEHNLSYFIPHPYLLGNKLKRLYPSVESMRTFLASAQGFEAKNACYLQLGLLFDVLPKTLGTRRAKNRICPTAEPPTEHFPSNVKFIAVGSDAHHPDELGPAVHIACEDVADRSSAFCAMISNTDLSSIEFSADRLSLRRLASTGWTTFTEGWIKHEYKREVRRSSLLRLPVPAVSAVTI